MTLDKSKEVVSKFSVEFFEKANTAVTNEFLAEGFVNHTAALNAPTGASGMIQFITIHAIEIDVLKGGGSTAWSAWVGLNC